jgi:dethiobiotin synthetase
MKTNYSCGIAQNAWETLSSESWIKPVHFQYEGEKETSKDILFLKNRNFLNSSALCCR